MNVARIWIIRRVMGSPYADAAQADGHALFKDAVHFPEVDAQDKENEENQEHEIRDQWRTVDHGRSFAMVARVKCIILF
jgi:hypothetical protein